jgi:uncharacterized membrane protein
MDWVTAALLSAISIGMVNILDSHLITKRMPSLRAYLLVASIFILGYTVVISILTPIPQGLDAWPLVVAILSGFIRTAGLGIFLYTLKTEEVSRVVPVVYTYPVLVAILAGPILGESLGILQWIAIFIVVSGAVMVAVKRNHKGITRRLGRPFLLLALASLSLAVAEVSGKYTLDYISSWNLYWITALCVVSVFIAISLRRSVMRQLGSVVKQTKTMLIVFTTETLAVVGMVLLFWALERGPVSLVSTISGSRPLFVFVFAWFLSRIWKDFLLEEKTVGTALAIRILATAMIVGGIAIIYLA